MTTLTLIALLALCCIVCAEKYRRKINASYLKYKLHREEYMSMFGPHLPMKEAFSEWTDNIAKFMCFFLCALILIMHFFSFINSGLWKAL